MPDERLLLVAAALAGYQAAADSDVWKGTVKSLTRDIRDPHLRAIFSLLSSNLDFESVLADHHISLLDKLGIALRYLDDAQVLLSPLC
jgi:hypothetical protein